MEVNERHTELFAMIANPTRLRILQLLANDPQLDTDKIITDIPTITEAMAREYIRQLRRSGIIKIAEKQRDERRVYYMIEIRAIQQAQGVLEGLLPRAKKTA